MQLIYTKDQYPLMWNREEREFITEASAIGLRSGDDMPFIITVTVRESGSVRDFYFSNGNFDRAPGYWIYEAGDFSLKIFND